MATEQKTKRCGACGALNPAGAEWCGQCLGRFRTTPPPPPPPPPGAPPSATPRGVGTRRGAFRVAGEGVLWECARCGTENPLDDQYCRACGAAFADTLRPAEEERAPRDPGTAAMISLFMPGAGHAWMGLWPQGVARAIISIWVVATAVLAAVQEAMTVAIVFGVAAFALWVIAAHDAAREAQGASDAVILKGKMFLYVVLSLLGLLIFLLFAAALRARG